MKIDAHHHLWDLKKVHYPWLMEKGAVRFFGDPTPIQRNYLIEEFSGQARAHEIAGSVHIQVGAQNPLEEAKWVQKVADENPDWPMKQVAFCDLIDAGFLKNLDNLQALPTVKGVRQIIGRAPGEDASSGTQELLNDERFATGLKELGTRGLSFDLQLIPELMATVANLFEKASDTKVALCHVGSPHDRSKSGLDLWRAGMKQLSENPNIHCKLSGIGMFDRKWTQESTAPIIETCLELFSADRCMFGSNFPVDSLYSDYAYLLETIHALVPEDMRDQVFGQTAHKFYEF